MPSLDPSEQAGDRGWAGVGIGWGRACWGSRSVLGIRHLPGVRWVSKFGQGRVGQQGGPWTNSTPPCTGAVPSWEQPLCGEPWAVPSPAVWPHCVSSPPLEALCLAAVATAETWAEHDGSGWLPVLGQKCHVAAQHRLAQPRGHCTGSNPNWVPTEGDGAWPAGLCAMQLCPTPTSGLLGATVRCTLSQCSPTTPLVFGKKKTHKGRETY